MELVRQLNYNAALDVDVEGCPKVRLHKIVCTIGPASQSVATMRQMLIQGMNVVRMNFSHGSHDYHRTTIANARAAAAELGVVAAIAVDTKGPEIRTGLFEGGSASIVQGQTVRVTGDAAMRTTGTASCFYIDLPKFWESLSVGGSIFIDDGVLQLTVTEVGDGWVSAVAVNTHTLSNHKGVNLPKVKVNLPAVSPKDREDLLFAVENHVDFIFASFIRTPQMVHDVRAILGDAPIKIFAKIENDEGIRNIDAIIEAADGVMVARGDLGVELPAERVVVAQKKIIAKCNIAGKPVICATQMLESMVVNPRPTRAEVSDVANAVLDGTDAVMLSGETAKGQYPCEVIHTMIKACCLAQAITRNDWAFDAIKRSQRHPLPPEDAICSSAVNGVLELGSKAIVTLTNTGRSAFLVAKYRPPCLIVAVSQDMAVCRSLAITRGVRPLFYDTNALGEDPTRDRRVALALEYLKVQDIVQSGDTVVAVHAHPGHVGFADETRVIIIN